MDSMTAVVAITSAIIALDSATSIKTGKIRKDVEQIERKQGELSDKGVKDYAEQYVSAWKNAGRPSFWNADFYLDWSRSYSNSPLSQGFSQDSTTAVLSEIYKIDTKAKVDLASLRKDVEKHEASNGKMSAVEVRRYAERYLKIQNGTFIPYEDTRISDSNSSLGQGFSQDSTTAVLSEIYKIDTKAKVDLASLRKDVEKHEAINGKMSAAEVRRYAERYLKIQNGTFIPFEDKNNVNKDFAQQQESGGDNTITLTNQETGETRKISMEEFVAMMQKPGSKVGIQQIVTDAQGNKTVTDIYGNMSGQQDGMDRSLNVFMKSDDIGAFVKAATNASEEDEDKSEEPDDNPYKGYIMTIDYTDKPFTWVLTITDETVKLYAYLRDETKSNRKASIKSEWKKENGSLSINQEEIEKDKNIVYVLAFSQIRKYLKKQGLLQKLRELDNKGAGVIVSAKNGSFSARIVQGKSRPNLPCLLFGGMFAQSLDEAVMMRPYVDEAFDASDDIDPSFDDLLVRAEAGDLDAMELIAMTYLNGDEGQKIKPDPKKAVYWFEEMASQGHSAAMFNLALHYAKGHGVRRDFEKAAEWMEKAAEAGDEDAPAVAVEYRSIAANMQKAEKGDAKAQAALAESLMKLGGSLDQAGAGDDYSESVKWAKKSADQGCADAFWTLGLAYEHGRGVEKDLKEAAECYQKGANAGHSGCQNNLGHFYSKGIAVKKDEKKAFELFMKSAEQGYGPAMQNLGVCYQFGAGCVGNMKKALAWYEKADEILNDPELHQRVIAFRSLADVDPDWDKDYDGSSNPDDALWSGPGDATETMRNNLQSMGKDASDDALANMSLEEAYGAFFGYDPKADRKKRLDELKDLIAKADKGDADAQVELSEAYEEIGRCYYSEPGDSEKAFSLAEKAAKKSPLGRTRLAYCHEHGIGTKRDKKKAEPLYLAEAQKGYAPAQYAYGNCLTSRKKEKEEGYRWIEKAAKQGYAPAMKAIAQYYETGDGIAPDTKKALEWYQKAQKELPDDEQIARSLEVLEQIRKPAAKKNSKGTRKADPEQYRGKIFVLTGIFDGYQDSQFKAFIESHGGIIKSSTVLATDYLIYGKDAEDTTKYKKAEELIGRGKNIQMIPARDFALQLFDPKEETRSIVYDIEADQVNCWVQKITVRYSSIPLEDAKLLFKLYNIAAGEYSKAANNDESADYAGMMDQVSEVREARRMMKEDMKNIPAKYLKQNYSGGEISAEMQAIIKQYPAKYGHLQKYIQDDFQFNFPYLFSDYTESFYWVDMTRVSEEKYDRCTSRLNHPYHMLELFGPEGAPVDFDDPDVISVFGTGKFEALADLSYGC